eukprot:1081362-Ditylum_brightwellii.AAC.1
MQLYPYFVNGARKWCQVNAEGFDAVKGLGKRISGCSSRGEGLGMGMLAMATEVHFCPWMMTSSSEGRTW